MKAALLTFVMVFGIAHTYGQDSGDQAVRQADDFARQANREAAENLKQFDEATKPDPQQDFGPSISVTCTPKLSIKTGKVALGTKVSITCSTQNAVIYYNTNGWTPTTASRRYVGPIPINATTNLQAFAVAPNMAHSFLAQATYTLKGTSTPIQPLALPADGILHAGTRLHLVTSTAVSSKTAKVGDRLNLQLDQDIKSGDTILVPKGTAVNASITKADASKKMGTPGDVSFTVSSLAVGGKQVPLKGGESLAAGDRHAAVVMLFVFVPIAGTAGFAIHGHDAEIKPGMALTAAVATDTPLQP